MAEAAIKRVRKRHKERSVSYKMEIDIVQSRLAKERSILYSLRDLGFNVCHCYRIHIFETRIGVQDGD